MTLRRITVSLLLAGLALFATVTPASAHTGLQSVPLRAGPIQVTGRHGAGWAAGPAPGRPAAGPVQVAPQAEATGGGIPRWVWIVVILPIVGLLLIGAIVTVRRRSSGGGDR
ncbi:hypothetical protein [Pseudonocardia acidicola]|uniref:MYXO-CTERM domain-containing protein n=1 Tax=Pseudonocardia acidicola TaxID=2724939 RepID=A0ABX1S7A1_9PSEU|nr:hypothetical protein [Pseudonocardia acidicola]NMH97416.1 hypothetical protein [Pseudonocardia acidicola]